MKNYKHLKDDIVSYGVRDLSRGKITEAVKKSFSQTVLIMKNNKPQSVILSYEEYQKLLKVNKDEK